MPELILGLDVGTTSARALVMDPSGGSLGKAQRRLATNHPSPGLAQQDARAVWQCLQATVVDALANAGVAITDIAGVGLTTQRSSVVIWDRATGQPLSPLVLWSDLRGAARSQELEDAGFMTSPLAASAKLEMVLGTVDQGLERMRRDELAWGTLDSYLLYCLTGGDCFATDYSNAWCTCYLDTSDFRSWNQDAIQFQGLSESMFPALGDSFGQIGTTAVAALGAEIPIGSVVADQSSGMFAHGAVEAGQWKATFGTSGTLMVSTGASPILDSALVPMLQFAQGEETVFSLEGMVISAGALLDWLVDQLGLFDSVEDLLAAAGAASNSGGVFVFPALQGLGAPHNDALRRAEIVGLSGASTSAEIARAALEGIAYRVREVVESVPEALIAASSSSEPLPLPVDGGLTVSDLFLQVLADCLSRPVERLQEPEATALGACMSAAIGLGLANRNSVVSAPAEVAVAPAISADHAQSGYEDWLKAFYRS